MKRNALTLVVGLILLVIFFLLLFTFQVRQTEVVVVTTFAKPSADPITKPGLYFKWPMPIQKVYRFDKRIHNFEDDNVLFQNSMQMMAELQKAGKHYETLIYPQRTHGVTGAARKHMYEAMSAFFDRHLKMKPEE